jgi:hypothetical protein
MEKNKFDDNTFKLLFTLISAGLIIICVFLVIFLMGCSSSRRIDKAKEVLGNSKLDAAKFCAENFPDKTEYIKGDSVVKFDTMYVGEVITDTIESKDTVYITEKLPARLITKTVRITDTIKVEDRAMLIVANMENEKLVRENIDLKESYENWRSIAKRRWNLWWLVLALVAFNFRKSIFKLIKFI